MNKYIEEAAPQVVRDYFRQQEDRRRAESQPRRDKIGQLKECAQHVYDKATLVDAEHLTCEVPLELIQAMGRALRAMEQA